MLIAMRPFGHPPFDSRTAHSPGLSVALVGGGITLRPGYWAHCRLGGAVNTSRRPAISEAQGCEADCTGARDTVLSKNPQPRLKLVKTHARIVQRVS
eukprot:2964809-Pyramimonas_sp.AAC.1